MKKLLFMLVCALLPITLWAQENEPYAVLSDNNTVLTFYYDDQKAARNGMGMTLSEGGLPEWAANRRDITSVVFDSSFGEYHGLTNITNWFNCDNLTLMTGMEYWNTDNVTVMYDTFAGCSKLETLDLSHFNTAMVTDMRFLFASCSSLKTIYVGDKWTTGQVQESESMFSGCISLVGGAGTTFDANHTDYTYAHIDGGTANPGYFTAASSSGLQAGMIIIDGQWNGIWEGSLSNGTAVMIDPQEVGKQYTLTYYGSMPTGTSILMVDVNNMVADYPNLSLRLDAIQTDRTTVNFDNTKVRYGDIEDNGKYRMEIYNIYGNTNGNSPIVGSTAASGEAETLLAFNDSISVKFTLMENSPVVNAEPYAVLSDNNTVLTFYYDDQKEARNGMSVGPFASNTTVSWYDQRENITSVVFDSSFDAYTELASTRNWFRGCKALTSITDIEYLHTDNVTDMDYMFYDCNSLGILDVSHFNTANVTNMFSMFYNCWSLQSLDVSGFNTSKVTNFGNLFYNCSGLTNLDVKNFDTSNATSTSYMFNGCSSLTTLDVSGFNTANVTDMGNMFAHCQNLTEINVSSFNTEKVTNMSGMFWDCRALKSLDLSNFNTANVTDMLNMIRDDYALETVNVSSFNTEKVTDMERMFEGAFLIKTLDLSSFNTANVTNMSYMLESCRELTTVYAGDGWSTANVTNSTGMFTACSKLVGGVGTAYDADHVDAAYARIDKEGEPGYFTAAGSEPYHLAEPYAVLSDNNTVVTFFYDDQKTARGGIDINNSYVYYGSSSPYGTATTAVFDASFAQYRPTSTAYWFHTCYELTTITGIENLNTADVTDMTNMFGFCTNLTSVDVSRFDTRNVTSMQQMFYSCEKLTSLDVSQFNTENVTTMHGMFDGCGSLTSLDVSRFNTQKVTDMSSMFGGCSGLTSLDVSHFDTQNVANMGWMFLGCSSLMSLDLSRFDTQKVTNQRLMFGSCSSLKGIDLSNCDMSNVTDVEYMFSGCSSLMYIIWGKGQTLTDQMMENVSNPNLLVYVNDASQAPSSVNNVIVNGQAKEIVLMDTYSEYGDFYCPQAFTAERISYSRTFSQRTEIGVSRGWETLALPFTVQTVTHQTRGQITPFGDEASIYHFWLRRLTDNGFQSVQTIEANTPYILSMPNNSVYPAEYNLTGEVTFAAQNAVVPVTEPVKDETSEYIMAPTFQRLPVQDNIYVLNVDEARVGHVEGSIFERSYRAALPFEAYTEHRGSKPAPRFYMIGMPNDDGTTGIATVGIGSPNTENWYDMQGRKLQGKPTKKGVYIVNGRKTVVK